MIFANIIRAKGALMAGSKSGSIETIPERSLAAKRRRRDAGETLPRSVRERVFMIFALALTCAASVVVSVVLVDRPVATWVHEHLGSERFGWFTTTYIGPRLKFGPFSLMASPAIAVGPLASFAFAILAIAGVAGWPPGIRSRT